MKVNFPGAQWVDITKRYTTFYCRPESSFLKSKSHFSATALTDAAGNPEVGIFSLQSTNENQLLALCEPNKYYPKNLRILLCNYKFTK